MMSLLFIVSALVAVIVSQASVIEEYNLALDNALFNPEEYICSICIDIIRQVSHGHATYDEMCDHYHACKIFDESFAQDVVAGKETSKDCEGHYRSTCEDRGYCMKGEYKKWRNSAESNDLAASSSLNLRVAKAYGARGRDKIRISVISNHTISNSLFTYSKPFQYRWTQFYLNTGVVSVTAGVVNQYNIDGQAVKVYVPKDDEGTRGVIIADPCFQSQWVTCKYQTTFDTLNRMTALLNAVNSHDDSHYWMILGDNFYDQTGYATDAWFAKLSLATKSKIIGSVAGNHDYWVHGSPSAYVPKVDQVGNGFMQYYGQDSAASFKNDAAHDATPFDFSVNPDTNAAPTSPEVDSSVSSSSYANKIGRDALTSLAALHNFFHYNRIGNVAFVGFSGAYQFSDTQKYFEEACSWAANEKTPLSAVVLVGHWNTPGDGCEGGLSVPSAYQKLLTLNACKPIASKLRYFEGHTHCNKVVLSNI